MGNHEEAPDPPRVSIVMSEYSTPPDQLVSSLESLLAQSFRDFELLLVDDCGSNDVTAIVEELGDPRIRVLTNSENIGLVRSLNKAFSVAQAKWVARADTDDLYLPNHLEGLLEAAARYPGFSVYSTRSIEFSDSDHAFFQGHPGVLDGKALSSGGVPNHPATLIDRKAVQSVGGYPNFDRAEDWALWFELYLRGHRLIMLRQATHLWRVDLADYEKKRLRTRWGAIRAGLHYYPKVRAGFAAYVRLAQMLFLGSLPPVWARRLRFAYMESLGQAVPRAQRPAQLRALQHARPLDGDPKDTPELTSENDGEPISFEATEA